jgi:hypothetical protein
MKHIGGYTRPGADKRTSRFRFGLRSVLLATALVAVVLWWCLPIVPGRISKWNAKMVRVGMPEAQVVELLGNGESASWAMTIEPGMSKHCLRYRVWNPPFPDEELFVSFDEATGNVAHVLYQRWRSTDE